VADVNAFGIGGGRDTAVSGVTVVHPEIAAGSKVMHPGPSECDFESRSHRRASRTRNSLGKSRDR
jgi:hypothetical protein